MALLKKIVIGVLTFVVLLVVLNYGVSYYISKKLPTIIQSQKDFPYLISYEDLDISLINGSFTIQNAFIAPKDSTETALQQGVFGKIKSLEVKNVNLWALLREDKIKVKKVIITKPDFILYNRKKKYDAEDDMVKPFKNSITTGSVEIINGSFKMLDSLQRFKLKAANINFKLDNIKVDSASVADNIPIRYTDYSLKCDSLFYQVSKFYHITANNLSTTDSTLNLTAFKLIPEHTRAQFTMITPLENDQFTVNIKNISIPALDWGYINNVLYVHSPKVVLDNVNANIYRNKLPKDDPSIKKLYSEVLRLVKFDLKVDKLLVKNTILEYEEQLNWQRPPGKLGFSKFYATVHNVYSPIRKAKMPDTTIDVEALFMKTTPLTVKWWFNVLDTSDSFTMKGHLRSIAGDNLTKLIKPLMNVEASGSLQDIKFTINGNRERAKGNFAIKYDDLKVEVYKKDGKKKDKLVTAIGNLLVKNDSDGKSKSADFEVSRFKDKSVFNLMSKCMQEGLKQTILPKAVSALIPKKDNK